jgi:hypothetical protein
MMTIRNNMKLEEEEEGAKIKSKEEVEKSVG